MDEHLKAFFRVVTAIIKWIGEHWITSLMTGGAVAYVVSSVTGIRG